MVASCVAWSRLPLLGQDVLDVADRWWARDFACPASELRPVATRVQEHAGPLVESSGIWILAVGPSPLISLPRAAMAQLAIRARTWSTALISDSAALAAEIGPLKVRRIVGPAFIGYGTAQTLNLSLAAGARELTRGDDEGVARLRAACSAEEWEHGGSDPHLVPSFGCTSDQGDVLALAGYKTWGREIAHISIVCAPQQRGRGLASAAVACAARHALAAGLLPQYRTLASNGPSMAVAKRLGFETYGLSVSVRLEPG